MTESLRSDAPLLRSLHLLAALFHLDLAEKRLLTQSELELGMDIASWWESRRA